MQPTKEYLLNCGSFNIIVAPSRRRYYLLGADAESAAVIATFMAGLALPEEKLQPHWFQYAQDETWHGFDGKERRINEDVSETQIIDYFVQKKFNFGSLVAVREVPNGKLQVFKRDKLEAASV